MIQIWGVCASQTRMNVHPLGNICAGFLAPEIGLLFGGTGGIESGCLALEGARKEMEASGKSPSPWRGCLDKGHC